MVRQNTVTRHKNVMWLKQAVRFHAAVQHEALPQFAQYFHHPPMDSHWSYDWIDGEGLRPERELSVDEVHPRGQVLCIASKLRLLMHSTSSMMSTSSLKEEASSLKIFMTAVLFITLRKKRVHLYDFDFYHPGPFINDRGRLYGSSRFMAPEEFQKGARIDERNKRLYAWDGRRSYCSLTTAMPEMIGRENDAMWHVAKKATNVDKQLRYPSVREFVSAWHAAITTGNISSA